MCVLDCKYPLGKKDGKEVKPRDVVKKIMRAWKAMVELPTQELYANALVEFQDSCGPPTGIKSAHALVKKYLDNSVGDLGETLCMDKEICGYVQMTSYGLPCACEIATKLLEEKPNLLDEIHHHWHSLKSKRVYGNWHFLKPPCCLHHHEKYQPREPRKKWTFARSKGKITSISRIPSSWEVVDFQNPDSQPSPSPTTSSYKIKKGFRLGKTSLSPLPPPSRYPKSKAIPVMRPIDYMSCFMHPFIEKVADVIGDGHCGFRAIAEFMGLTEQNHIMIRTLLIQELKDDHVEVFTGEDRYNYIFNGLHPPANTKSCAHLVDKWLTFSDMGHIVANYYKRCVVVLTNLEVGKSDLFSH
ncbi:hypothetical protein MTR_1g081010 [Medicago truncatula]|uniref:OTU domain-containing protein n=1 Tax=Medicago truncatula TaxID=3880 RepID=A0A072VN23_MEDTR|nr:hypothetical protein MTR_1g081010 [Medicago truncatula]